MNSGLDLRVQRSLELLGILKETAARFAQREEALAKESSGRRYVVGKTAQDATAAKDAQYQEQLAQVEAYFVHEKNRAQVVSQARLERISRYQANLLKNLPRLIEETKGNYQASLQRRNNAAQRKMKENIANSDADYDGFKSKLDGYWANLGQLQNRAKSAFGGILTLRALIGRRKPHTVTTESNMGQIQQEIGQHIEEAGKHLFEFEDLKGIKFFAKCPLFLIFLILGGVAGFNLWQFKGEMTGYIAAGVAGGLFLVVWIIQAVTVAKAKPQARLIGHAIVEARRWIQGSMAAGPQLQASREALRGQIEAEYAATKAEIDELWSRTDDVGKNYERRQRNKLETQVPRITQKIQTKLQPQLDALEGQRLGWHEQLKANAAATEAQIAATQQADVGTINAGEAGKWDTLAAEWHQELEPVYREIELIQTDCAQKFPAWSPEFVEKWHAPVDFIPATQFGSLTLNLGANPEAMPHDPRLALPGPALVTLPMCLTYPHAGSLLFETKESGSTAVVDTMNNVLLRLFATTPPGKLACTFIDPIGLGQNFSGLMHLGDYEEALVNRRIWTQRDQIEERLQEMNEHIEKVIQMYLRNEYATITEYNEKAGSVAEKYYVLVIADFPANFSEVAIKRLTSIAQSGPRCGIFTLVHWDSREKTADGSTMEELRKSSVILTKTSRGFTLGKEQTELGLEMKLDAPASPELSVELVHKIGKASIDSNRVQVPFSQIAPAPGHEWEGDTTEEMRVAIGRTGATKHQMLAIGKGTRQHALFAGKTGSGKSTLFHVIITNLALTCSPDQVQFYLIDFKKGVEFKCYANRKLPHAKVVAIESDREFALSVLAKVDDELKRRGDLFRKLGVQNVAGYKREGGDEPMPRIILLIDEFQEFFVEDDAVAQNANLLFDRLVRQGRAFGIHVLLGSQSLGGAYTLPRTTMGQMGVRVALQCNEADAYLIMDESNSAPRLLSRPGEGIYNDAAGAVDGNSPFQVVWLPDEERDLWLDKVHALMEAHPEIKPSTPIVFEGNAPSDTSENEELLAALNTPPAKSPLASQGYLGAPNSIKGPTAAVFQRQSGSNLLVVSQRDEAVMTMFGISLLSLAAQYPVGKAKFVVCHQCVPGSPESDFFEAVIAAIPHEVTVVRGQDVTAAIDGLATDLKERMGNETSAHEMPETFLFIHGLQKFKKLKSEDDFGFGGGEDGPNTGSQFNELISEGAGYGIHIVATIDTLANVNRFMNRKAIGEFSMRVISQMSANDSASLIDNPKASNLGLHRAIYYNEQEGYMETFRPYAPPHLDWVRQAAEKLAPRKAAAVCPGGGHHRVRT